MKRLFNWLLSPIGVQLYNSQDISDIVWEAGIIEDYGSVEAYEELLLDSRQDLEDYDEIYYQENVLDRDPTDDYCYEG